MNPHRLQQWSDVVVERTIEWEDGPEGGAVLLVPRFRRGPLARWLQPRLRRPHIRVKLDDVGSFAWRRFDGAATFSSIVAQMQECFGARVEPAGDRLQQFLAMLYKDRFVRLYQPAAGTAAGPGGAGVGATAIT